MAMPERISPRFEAVTPRLPVHDVDALLDFYIGKLGFSLGWKWGKPVTHANVYRGSVSFDLIAVSEARRGTAMAYCRVVGVDDYHAELRARSVGISAVEDRPYGMRDFEIADP